VWKRELSEGSITFHEDLTMMAPSRPGFPGDPSVPHVKFTGGVNAACPAFE